MEVYLVGTHDIGKTSVLRLLSDSYSICPEGADSIVKNVKGDVPFIQVARELMIYAFQKSRKSCKYVNDICLYGFQPNYEGLKPSSLF